MTTPPLTVSPGEAEHLAAVLYGVRGDARPLDGERDSNFVIAGDDGNYSLKIFNPAETTGVAEMQQSALLHLAESDPELPIPRPIATIDGAMIGTMRRDTESASVRLLSWLEGQAIADGYSSPRLRHNLGTLAARLDRALVDFTHPDAGRDYLWDVARLSRIQPLTEGLESKKREVATRIISRFLEVVAPVLVEVPRQVIHSDLNPENVLVDLSDPDTITGVIDFSDVIKAPRVIEPAIAAAYQCLHREDSATVISEVVAAYHSVLPLSSREMGLVPDLVMARLVQSLVIGLWHATINPQKRGYILIHSEPAWEALRHLDALDRAVLAETIGAACEAIR